MEDGPKYIAISIRKGTVRSFLEAQVLGKLFLKQHSYFSNCHTTNVGKNGNYASEKKNPQLCLQLPGPPPKPEVPAPPLG